MMHRLLPQTRTAILSISTAVARRAATAPSSSPSSLLLASAAGRARDVSSSSSTTAAAATPHPPTLKQPKKKAADVPASAADRRLAGRRRFYDAVGVASCRPPWEEEEDAAGEGGGEAENKADESSVESPISAGVDGTQSGSGIATAMPTTEAMRRMLIPRPPGVSFEQHQQRGEGEGEGEGKVGAEGVSWYTVTLDGRPLRTPLGVPLSVPSQTLALSVASEWSAQRSTLQPAQMPLMTLVCTALDQVASQPQFYREECLRYLANDTTCYLADPKEDRVLNRLQRESWDELHAWAEAALGGHKPAVAVGHGEGLLLSRRRRGRGGGGRSGLPHPDELVKEATEWVMSLDAWNLIALRAACAESKSFLVGMALVKGSHPHHDHALEDEDGDVDDAIDAVGSSEASEDKEEAAASPPPPFAHDASRAVKASRVEEEFNIENWGLVEGGHDYDRLNCSVQIRAARVLVGSIAVENQF